MPVDYKSVLSLAGYPEEVVVLDFETYFDSEYTLRKFSTIEYITDERFEFTGLGVKILHKNKNVPPYVEFRCKVESIIDNLQSVYGKNLKGCTLVVANAKFDVMVLADKFGIVPPYVVDIQDIARGIDARMSHSVKDLATMFGLPPKGDTMNFKGLHLDDMSVEKKVRLGVYCNRDVEIESDLFEILLPKMSNPEVEIPFARHILGLYLTPSLVFDFKMAEELLGSMQSLLLGITDITGQTLKDLSGNISFVKLLQGALPGNERVPVKKGKPGKSMVKLLGVGNIPALSKDDVGFQALLAHSDPKVRNLCKARQAVKSWPLHTKRITNMVRQAKASNGLMRVPFIYYGCHTGRDSGGEGINLKNLGGKGRAGSGTNPLISKVRNLLQAPEGKVLAIVDSAQIEARLLAWFAGQYDLVTGFTNNEDIYSVFASRLFGTEVRKPMESDGKLEAIMMKVRRGFGKDAILGCGYGMGANKFYNRCYANEELRPSFDSGNYTFQFIERLIKTYRTTYSEIPKFWGTVESMFGHVIKYPKKDITYYFTGSNTLHEHLEGKDDILKNALLTNWNEDGTVFIQLPSGRTLRYGHAKFDKKRTICWHHGKLWGGSITENIVQATARDLFVHWIFECERRGYPVVFHCYDELVCLVDEDTAEDSLNDIIGIMREGPDWSSGVPLDAEGGLSKVYTK